MEEGGFVIGEELLELSKEVPDVHVTPCLKEIKNVSQHHLSSQLSARHYRFLAVIPPCKLVFAA